MKHLPSLLVLLLVVFACTGSETPESSTAEASSPELAADTPSEESESTAETESMEAEASQTDDEKEEAMDYNNTVAELETDKGTIVLGFFPDVAPNHVENFVSLSKEGYYTGTKFHRIIPGFMIQGGDPNTKFGSPSTWGTGGSGRNVAAEFNDTHHRRGIVSMARGGDPDSASSQFFIVVADYGSLDNQYSVFGEVLSGMEVVDEIVNAPKGPQDRPNDPVSIKNITIREPSEEEKGKMSR